MPPAPKSARSVARANGGSGSGHTNKKKKSTPGMSVSGTTTMDEDFLESLQKQIEKEKKHGAVTADILPKSASKKKRNKRRREEDEFLDGIEVDPSISQAELRAAMAEAAMEGKSDESEDDEVRAAIKKHKAKKQKEEAKRKRARGSKDDGMNAPDNDETADADAATGDNNRAQPSASQSDKKTGHHTRVIRRPDESEEEFKLRLKADLRRRKQEKKKAVKSAKAAEEAARKQEEKLRERQLRVEQEKAAKMAKLQALQALQEMNTEGLTNKQKRLLLKQQKAAISQGTAPTNAASDTGDSTKQQQQDSNTANSKSKSNNAASASAAASASSTSIVTAAPLPASAWDAFDLHPTLLRALLFDLQFMKPTPIQESVLLPAIRDWKDISAAATTGSGKTLAFGLPILHRLLTLRESKDYEDPQRMQALILTPTRELALQIVQHLEAVSKHASPPIRIAPIVGGMSSDKQKRVLEKNHPEVIVATPGRLWELMSQERVKHLASSFYLRFLVLDEADRMVDFGHFPELEHILHFIQRTSSYESMQQEVSPFVAGVEAFDGFELIEDGEEAINSEQTMRKIDGIEEDADEQDEDVEDDEAEEESDDESGSKKKKKKGARAGRVLQLGVAPEFQKSKIDWSSFLSEEEIFRKEGRKMPRARANIEKVEEESDDDDNEEEETNQDEDDEMDEDGDVDDAEQDEEPSDADNEQTDKEQVNAAASPTPNPVRRQIFLFSATLTLASSGREDASKLHLKKNRRRHEETVLEKLASRLPFNGRPFSVDLSRAHQVAETLQEVQATCVTEDKDYLVYYFLLLYPGKTLIFVNAISCLRRLVHLLNILKLPAIPLHAEMQQKARLKSLERFKKNERAILICTDVAARGLDIPQVPYIVHYQLPRTSEIYIHRSGRVARAGASGLSFAIISENDQKQYRRLCQTLRHIEGIPSLQIEHAYMNQIRDRLNLARKVDELENHLSKHRSKRDWFRKHAEAMDMEIDEDELQIRDDDEDANELGGSQSKETTSKLDGFKKELDGLLAKPLLHGTLSRKFFTLNQVRGFDLATNSAAIARAGTQAFNNQQNGGVLKPQVAVGMNENATNKLPSMLQQARIRVQKKMSKTGTNTPNAAAAADVTTLSKKKRKGDREAQTTTSDAEKQPHSRSAKKQKVQK